MEHIEHHFEETPREHVLHERFDAIRSDPHLEGVAWDELETKDIGLLDKLSQGTLTEGDIDRRREELEGEGREGGEDSSADFVAMLSNKLLAQKYFENHKAGNA
ncbi:MAG: hypothetical protein AAB630_02750 [Patescibacteria group bacterium]